MWSFTVKVLLVITLLHALWFLQIDALKCRKDTAGQEAHFKRVIRSCMRKMAEMGNNRNEHGNSNNNNNRYNYARNFNISDNNNSNNNRNRYNQRDSYYNPSDERNKYGSGNNNDEYGGNKYGGNRNLPSNRYNQQQQQQQQQRQGDYDHYSGWNTDDDEGKYGDQRRGQNGGNSMFNSSACVVHCFFSDLNMVNENGYPDRNQINYLLSQGTRDRELKAFYSDSLQKCFHFVDSKQHRDRCYYSRDIAQCLMEYATANCEDLQSHSIMFN